MRVLYDYQAFSNRKAGGVSRYFLELIRRLCRAKGVDVEVMAGLYLNDYLREDREAFGEALRGWLLPEWVPAGRAVSLANRVFFSCARRFSRPDIYHPTYFNWLAPSSPVKKVVTVFDMTHELYPQCFPSDDPTRERKRHAVEHADGVICISENTKRDLLRVCSTPEEKVRVVHLASSLDQCRAEPLTMACPFFLYVGNRAGYKNWPVVLRAVASNPLLKATSRVVCYGGEAPGIPEDQDIGRLGLSEAVAFVSGPDAKLAGLYKAAVALVYPSLYEGFGLPPLEAMQLGCPVLVSDRSAIPEVVGEAGIYFNPEDPADLAGKMERVLSDESLRENLSRSGRVRAQSFTWDVCAQETLVYYAEILGGREPKM